MMNAISKSPPEVRNKVRGVVFFGYTKNGQQKSSIPNYPKDRVKVFCTQSDGVCWGKLSVTAGHFAYMGNGSGPQAVSFLVNSLKGSVASVAGGSEEAEAPATPAPKASGKLSGGKGKGKVS
jgi:cutinase